MLSSLQDEADGALPLVGLGGEVCGNLDLCSRSLTLLFQVDYADLDTTEEWDADAILFPAVEVSLF